jgi:diguanylate cyclase (GGDEF)-like protein
MWAVAIAITANVVIGFSVIALYLSPATQAAMIEAVYKNNLEVARLFKLAQSENRDLDATHDMLSKRVAEALKPHLAAAHERSRGTLWVFATTGIGAVIALLIATCLLERRTRQKQAAEFRIHHLAYHDALTNLPNRLLLHQRLEQTMAGGRRIQPVAVLSLDLDHFKNVNDALGHPVGDALLKAVAQRLRHSIRETDTVARMGGDEFVFLLIGAEASTTAEVLSKRIIATISTPFDIGGDQLVVGASIGIAISPKDGNDPDSLLKHSDMALYSAKRQGRGTYCFFDHDMNKALHIRRALEQDLRKALSRNEFELHYQPIIHLERNEICAFEALLRWRHPERGIIAPAEFIPLAEETGLIVPIGEWVVRRACSEAASWPVRIKVAVNLSSVQFIGTTLLESVCNALSSSSLAPERLELEITESVLLERSQLTLTILHQLRKLGVHIALDDFGTGYSSLSYLRSFPFSKIKIDRSFTADLTMGQPDSLAIIRAVVQLANALGMSTTAEGVETQGQLLLARTEGCTEVQGNLFGLPKSTADVTTILSQPEDEIITAA